MKILEEKFLKMGFFYQEMLLILTQLALPVQNLQWKTNFNV